MTKTLTEQWRDGTLPEGYYYLQYDNCAPFIKDLYGMSDLKKCIDSEKIKVLSPVPDYGFLYNPNDGRIPVGLFTVLKIIERDIEQYQKIRHLTDLECGIKSQVVSLLKRHNVK